MMGQITPPREVPETARPVARARFFRNHCCGAARAGVKERPKPKALQRPCERRNW